MVQYAIDGVRTGYATPVGPPWVNTISGGRSSSGPRTWALVGRYRKALVVAPSGVSTSMGSGSAQSSGASGTW